MSLSLVTLPTSGESAATAIRKRNSTCRKFGPNYDLRHVWRSGDHAVELWAKTTGRAGNENKSELPPPVAQQLYFGPIYLVKAERRTATPVSFSLEEWRSFYDEQFGGFDDLDEEESSSEDELDGVDQSLLTRDGYMKDGFVVDTSDVDDGESAESGGEPEAVSSDASSSDPGDALVDASDPGSRSPVGSAEDGGQVEATGVEDAR